MRLTMISLEPFGYYTVTSDTQCHGTLVRQNMAQQ